MDAFDNPFHVLKASVRDDKPRLLELAEELALHGDADAAAQARTVLVNPRNRLVAEVAWFPGVEPARLTPLLEAARAGRLPGADGAMSPLCRANLAMAALSGGATPEATSLRDAILEIAADVDAIDAGQVREAINADRALAGFPPVAEVAAVEEEVAERCRHFQRVLTRRLDDLPTAEMVATYEAIAAAGGEAAPPRLVDDLLAAYELHAGDYLANEAGRIVERIEATRLAADGKAPPAQVRHAVEEIIAAIGDWDRVAQPIQLARRRRGLDHEDSKRVAFRARGLAVHLFNAHDYLKEAQRLSDALQHDFAEVAAVSDVVGEDQRALRKIAADREERAARDARDKAEFAARNTYETTFGMIFKDAFRISPEGLHYKGRAIPLDSITGVAWGAVRHITNGRETGTFHYFRYGTAAGSVEIVMDKDEQYHQIVARAWRVICVPILFRFMDTWRQGGSVHIGGQEVRDEGLVLKKSKTFRADELRFHRWPELKKLTQGGKLEFRGVADAEFLASFNFREHLNAHVLDFAVERVWQGKADRLSRIFDQENTP